MVGGHDVLVRHLVRESVRMFVIYENHKTLVSSKIAFATEFHGMRSKIGSRFQTVAV